MTNTPPAPYFHQAAVNKGADQAPPRPANYEAQSQLDHHLESGRSSNAPKKVVSDIAAASPSRP